MQQRALYFKFQFYLESRMHEDLILANDMEKQMDVSNCVKSSREEKSQLGILKIKNQQFKRSMKQIVKNLGAIARKGKEDER